MDIISFILKNFFWYIENSENLSFINRYEIKDAEKLNSNGEAFIKSCYFYIYIRDDLNNAIPYGKSLMMFLELKHIDKRRF